MKVLFAIISKHANDECLEINAKGTFRNNQDAHGKEKKEHKYYQLIGFLNF